MNWLFRTDVGKGVGLGHFIRDFALANAAQQYGVTPYFLLTGKNAAAERLLAKAGFGLKFQPGAVGSLLDHDFTARLANELNAAVIVVDGYRFGSEFYVFGPTVVAIDERPIAPPVDFLVDIDPDASKKSRVMGQAKLLAGPSYALLRTGFVTSDCVRTIRPNIERVLVMLGGEDVRGQTDVVLDGLELFGFNGLVVVIATAQTLARRFDVEQHRFVENTADLMRSVDLAFTACGGTVWELCATGTPSCVIISADNQRSIGKWVRKEDVAENLGWWQRLQPEDVRERLANLSFSRRQELSRAARRAVDGLGARRVIRAILEAT